MSKYRKIDSTYVILISVFLSPIIALLVLIAVPFRESRLDFYERDIAKCKALLTFKDYKQAAFELQVIKHYLEEYQKDDNNQIFAAYLQKASDTVDSLYGVAQDGYNPKID